MCLALAKRVRRDRDFFGPRGGRLGRQIRQQVNPRLPTACRPIQYQCHPPDRQEFIALVLQPQGPLVQHPGLTATDPTTPALAAPAQRRSMLPNEKETPAPDDPEKKAPRAEIAAGDPQVPARHLLEDRIAQ